MPGFMIGNGRKDRGNTVVDSCGVHGYNEKRGEGVNHVSLATAARVNPLLAALKDGCPVACSGVVDFTEMKQEAE